MKLLSRECAYVDGSIVQRSAVERWAIVLGRRWTGRHMMFKSIKQRKPIMWTDRRYTGWQLTLGMKVSQMF